MKIRKRFSMKTSQDSKQVKLITRGLTGVSVVLFVCSLWPYDDDAIALAPSIDIPITAPPSPPPPLPLPNGERKSSIEIKVDTANVENEKENPPRTAIMSEDLPNKPPRTGDRQKVSFVDYSSAITVRVRPPREKLQLTSREMRKKAGTLYFFDTASMAHFCCHHGGEPICAPICIKGLPGYHHFEMFQISNTSSTAMSGEVEKKGKHSVILPPFPMLYDSDDFKSRCAPLPGLKYFPRLDGPPRPFDIREEDACLGGGWEKILPSLRIRANLSEIGSASSGLPPDAGGESAMDYDRDSGPFMWLFDNQKKSSSDVLTESREDISMNTITWNVEADPPFCVQADGTVEMLAKSNQSVVTEVLHVAGRSSSLFAKKNVRMVDSLGAKKGGPALIIPIKSRGKAIRDSLHNNSSPPDAKSVALSSFAASQAKLFVRAAHTSAQLRRASDGRPPAALLFVAEISDPREALHLSSLDARGALHTNVLFASYYALLDLPTFVVNVALEAPTRSSVFSDSRLFSSHKNVNLYIGSGNRGRQLVPTDVMMNERFSRSVWNEAVRLLFLEAKHLRALRGRKHQCALDAFVPDLEPWKLSAVPKDPTEEEIFAELGKQPPTSPDALVRIGDEKLYEGRLDVYLAKFLRRTLSDLDENERNAKELVENKSEKMKKCFSGGIYFDDVDGVGDSRGKSGANGNAEVSGDAISLEDKMDAARRIAAQCAFGSSLPASEAQTTAALNEKLSSRKHSLSSSNELMSIKAAGEHFLLTEAAERELSELYASVVVLPHGEGKDLSSRRKKYDETFMRLLEAHPIRLTWLINTKTSSPTTHAEIASLFSTARDNREPDRSSRSATFNRRIRLINEHFVTISKEFSKHISFFFSDGVDKERVEQVRRLMGHTDIVLSEEGMGGAAGLVRDGILSASSFSLRDSALLVELGTTTESASGSHSVKNEAHTKPLGKKRSHSYLRIPSRFAVVPSDYFVSVNSGESEKRHNALTLDETRTTISLAVCSWLASNAVRLNKPFLVPFWCSRENAGEKEESPLLLSSSTRSSSEEAQQRVVHVSSHSVPQPFLANIRKYPTVDDVENLVKLTEANRDRKTFLPDWLYKRVLSFGKGTETSSDTPEQILSDGEISSIGFAANTYEEPKRTPYGGFVVAKCRPIAELVNRNDPKKRNSNHNNDDETHTPLQVPPRNSPSNSPLLPPPHKLLSFPYVPNRDVALSLFEDAVQAMCADLVTSAVTPVRSTEIAKSSPSLAQLSEVSSALDDVHALFHRLRSHAFLGLRGLLESLLLLPLEAASELSHLIIYGNPRLLTFYRKRADQLRIQAESDTNNVNKRSRRRSKKKANGPSNSQLDDAVVDVESMCGLKHSLLTWSSSPMVAVERGQTRTKSSTAFVECLPSMTSLRAFAWYSHTR